MGFRFSGIVVVNFQGGIILHGVAHLLFQRGVRQLHQMHQLNRQRQTHLPLNVLLL